MRGPARQMRMAARGRTRRQHRVHDRHAGLQQHERAVQHAALPRARNPQGAGAGHVRRMGWRLRPGRAHRGTETRRQWLPGQAKVRAVPEPARADERGEAVHRHDHQRRHPAAIAGTGTGARARAHHRPAEGGDGGTVRQGGPRARRRRAAGGRQPTQDHGRRTQDRPRPQAPQGTRGRPAVGERQDPGMRRERRPDLARGDAAPGNAARLLRLEHARVGRMERLPGPQGPARPIGRAGRTDRVRPRRWRQPHQTRATVREGPLRRDPRADGKHPEARHRHQRAGTPRRDPRPRLPLASRRPGTASRPHPTPGQHVRPRARLPVRDRRHVRRVQLPDRGTQAKVHQPAHELEEPRPRGRGPRRRRGDPRQHQGAGHR